MRKISTRIILCSIASFFLLFPAGYLLTKASPKKGQEIVAKKKKKCPCGGYIA